MNKNIGQTPQMLQFYVIFFAKFQQIKDIYNLYVLDMFDIASERVTEQTHYRFPIVQCCNVADILLKGVVCSFLPHAYHTRLGKVNYLSSIVSKTKYFYHIVYITLLRSIFGAFETVITALSDQWPTLRPHKPKA